jgi:hypothetical protein
MPVSKSKKFFFILFLVVSFLWIGYQAILLPTLQKRHADAQFAQAIGECTNNFRASVDVDVAAEHDCMVRAEGMYVIRRTAASQIYSSQGLPGLFVRCLSFPLLSYGLFRAVAARRRKKDSRNGGASMHDQFA